ncbi:MAG: carbamoyl-phosphate synthase large subunit, partial [Polyangiales bacterium]
FAIHPETGRQLVIEMNPRVSRSSALASKATGYPIAKVAAKLAVGYTLDELKNDITGTSAAFEPSIDYVVCKIPRFAFEKFAGADARLTTQMKSVGEAMGIGRSFAEALQKAALSLENGRTGLQSLADKVDYVALAALLEQVRRAGKPLSLTTPPRPAAGQAPLPLEQQKDALLSVLRTPLADRLWFVCDALRAGVAEAEVQAATSIDPWFVAEIAALMRLEARIRDAGTGDWSWLAEAKRQGFADRQLAALRGVGVQEVAAARKAAAVAPAFCQVDTCAAEFVAHTPYFYSTWGQENEAQRQPGEKVLILGGGPNRIGQGIEFDYCCVHACFALRELGIAPVMLNCNPETVSTDYDTSDRLYFEPLTLEHVLAVAAQEQVRGVIVQFGGQTPIRLAQALTAAGVKVLGTPADAIDRAEDRERFDALLQALGLRRPHGGIARGVQEARNVAASIGYPLVVRPSYVLGGRGMEVVHDEAELTHYFQVAFAAAQDEAETTTILLDEYVRGAIEVDVDALCDGEQVFIGGVMQHIEEAGVHSGDSALVLPAHALPPEVQGAIRAHTRALALKLGVVGLLNVQFAVRGNDIFVIEVNPRASRTVPFVSKAIGVPLAKVAAKLMLGQRLADLGLHREPTLPHVAVKESVLPFTKFPGVDTLLGPEMRSTGEVMGLGPSFP